MKRIYKLGLTFILVNINVDEKKKMKFFLPSPHFYKL